MGQNRTRGMSATRSPSRRRPEGSSPAKAVLEGSQVRKRLRYFPGVPSHYTQLPNIFTDKSAHVFNTYYPLYIHRHIHYTHTPSIAPILYIIDIHTPRHIHHIYIHPPYTVYTHTPAIYITHIHPSYTVYTLHIHTPAIYSICTYTHHSTHHRHSHHPQDRH